MGVFGGFGGFGGFGNLGAPSEKRYGAKRAGYPTAKRDGAVGNCRLKGGNYDVEN